MPGIGSAAERRCRGFLSVFPKKSADEASETYKPARSQQAIDKKYSTHVRIRPGCTFDLETHTLELHRAFRLMQEDNKDECNRSGPRARRRETLFSSVSRRARLEEKARIARGAEHDRAIEFLADQREASPGIHARITRSREMTKRRPVRPRRPQARARFPSPCGCGPSASLDRVRGRTARSWHRRIPLDGIAPPRSKP